MRRPQVLCVRPQVLHDQGQSREPLWLHPQAVHHVKVQVQLRHVQVQPQEPDRRLSQVRHIQVKKAPLQIKLTCDVNGILLHLQVRARVVSSLLHRQDAPLPRQPLQIPSGMMRDPLLHVQDLTRKRWSARLEIIVTVVLIGIAPHVGDASMDVYHHVLRL